MRELHIEAGDRSPAVEFDQAAGRMSIRGESYPEDASRVFAPIFGALEAYLADGSGRALHVDMELIYFNSSSAKALMNLFVMLDRAAANGTGVTVDWRYAPEDDTMREFGEDFSEDLEHVIFNLVIVEGAD
jgi:hypothetical protein